MPPTPGKQGDATALWRISGMGVELVGGMLGMMAIGWFIDRWQGTSPRWTTVGAIVGLLGGGINFIRKALALNRAEAERYRRSHPPLKKPDNSGAPTGEFHE